LWLLLRGIVMAVVLSITLQVFVVLVEQLLLLLLL